MRVAITGYGTLNALGSDAETFSRGLREGRCGIGDLTVFDPAGFRCTRAAQVDAEDLAPLRASKRLSRTARLALRAAAEACRRAGLGPEALAAAGVIVGTSTGGIETGEEEYRRVRRRGDRPGRLSRWLETPMWLPTDAVAESIGARGPRLTVSTACSSGANALGLAADWIRAGRVEIALCGGADALCRTTFAGFDVLQALDRDRCRPFDARRAGLTLGEGAAMFVLESWDSARARGAAIFAELAGYGISADAHHLTQPRPDGAGAVAAMKRAMADCRTGVDEIDYVNAHGTGTKLNDSIETRAIKQVFGDRAGSLPVSSTKSMIGHCLGAAGAIEALACVVALREGFVPPTVGLEEPDPECDLDYVPMRSRPAVLRAVLSNSYGFGGNNTSMVFRAAS